MSGSEENSVVVISESPDGDFTQNITAGNHSWTADEPERWGGDDTGPNPYDMLLASLGACTSMTIRSYARKKDIPLDHVEITLTHSHHHVDDCEHCDERDRKLERIEKYIRLKGSFSDEQKTRLIDISKRCPIHRTLEANKQIITVINDA